jgi:alpha-mannosidase
MRVRALGWVVCVFAGAAVAQSFTPVRELKNLSPAAIDKLQMLEMLNALPVGEWRYHVGDVAHGEAVGLDDSAWPQGEPKQRQAVKGPKEAIWYRRTITVPLAYNGYDLTGSRIWFQFEADANGPMPEIIYFNGRRVALGDDLEPIVLFEHARPGDKILVAVKLLHTVDDKTWRGVQMRIEPDPAMGRPNPDDMRTQIIAAANILPSLPQPRKDLLPKVEDAVAAVDLSDLDAANKALFADRGASFEEGEKKFGPMLKETQAKFDASLKKAQEILSELQPVLAQAKVVEDGNSHIDAAWLWPRSETIDVVRRTFTTALQLMQEYPDYTYTQSAAQYNAWMADKYPKMNDEIRQRIKEGRWEIVGGMWVEPDLNLPGGESLVRQLLVGQRYFQKEYGVFARIGWNPDSFGYNWQLPQIYKRSGMDYFVTQKMHWNDTNQLPFRLFWWESPDGSKVLTYFPTDYVHDNVSPTRISADFAESAQRNPGTTEMLDLYGIGDHGGGPTRAMLDQADKWMAAGKTGGEAVPAMHYGTAQSYFSSVEKKLNPDSPVWNYDKLAQGWTAPAAAKNGAMGIPTWKDELYFEYHRGVFTSQAAHKRNMRVSETETLDAEKLASLAWLDGAKYPAEELTEDWKKITFNQFHDLAAGSGIAVIYRDAQKDFTEVAHSDRVIADGAMSELSAKVDTREQPGSFLQGKPDLSPVLILNPTAWKRSGTAEVHVQLPSDSSTVGLLDSTHHWLQTQVLSRDGATNSYEVLVDVPGVPAMGYTVLQAVGRIGGSIPFDETSVDAKELPGSFSLSNDRLRVVIDKKTGCIASLVSLPVGTEFLTRSACGNELQAFVDKPKQYDAWNIDPGTLDMPPAIIDKVDSISILNAGALFGDGSVRKTVRVTRHWQNSKFVQDISLDAGADEVVVKNDIDWHEKHVLLKAAFPLAASGPKATYEIPFGSIERPTTRNNSFEKAKFEVPALRWADLGDDKQGVSILNDSKYGYDAVGNVLRLTLLRSPTWPDENADQGEQKFTYAIYPHAGTWKDAQTVRRGYELNDPLKAEQVFSHTGALPAEYSFASVENANVTLTAVKKAEDSDALVFRMYEWAGKASEVKLHVPKGAEYAVESNLMEKVEGGHLPLAGNVVTVPIKPYEILTVQVAYRPAGK